jgi:hypothetical protein
VAFLSVPSRSVPFGGVHVGTSSSSGAVNGFGSQPEPEPGGSRVISRRQIFFVRRPPAGRSGKRKKGVTTLGPQ